MKGVRKEQVVMGIESGNKAKGRNQKERSIKKEETKSRTETGGLTEREVRHKRRHVSVYMYRPLEGQGSSSTEGHTVQGEECGEEGKKEGNERELRRERDEGWRETVQNRKIGEKTDVKRRKQEKREGKHERWGSRDKKGRVGRRDTREK